MAHSNSRSYAVLLENYRVALENAVSSTAISTALAGTGYDDTVINQGKALLLAAQTAYATNQTEDDETLQAYSIFSSQRDAVSDNYRIHRKKAKVLFRKDLVAAQTLDITGSIPQAYVKWLDSIKRFYTTIDTTAEIKAKMATLAVTEEDVSNALSAIEALEAARADYLREKGESQAATRAKDKALRELSQWMSDFYAIARIALKDQPQLLEALGKVVR